MNFYGTILNKMSLWGVSHGFNSNKVGQCARRSGPNTEASTLLIPYKDRGCYSISDMATVQI